MAKKSNSILPVLSKLAKPTGLNPYIKSSQVKEILLISESKLETLRRNGTLPCTKLQGTYYYLKADVLSLLPAVEPVGI